MSLLLGLDVGTAGARAVAIDLQGNVCAQSSAGYQLLRPRPGWTEQRPEDWWTAAQEVLGRVAREVRGHEIAGLGLTGQMHGSVFLDREDAVIRPALLWNDQRTAAQAEEIGRLVGRERLVEIAGNPPLTGFQAPKIRWLAECEPAAWERVRTVLLPKDFIRLRLCGERATDASDASGTLLLDVRARRWSQEILDALEISLGLLPEVVEGTEPTGGIGREVAERLGLPPGLLVAAGGGDNAAAAVGLGIVREGLMSSSIGTSGVLFAHCDRFTPDPSLRLHACCHAFPDAYHLMAVTLSAGASLEWWRAAVGADLELDALVQEAERVPAGAGGLLFLPYLSGERTPHADPEARGALVGLEHRHRRADVTRAVMEGVVFSLRDGLEVMRELGLDPGEVRATGGGARSPLWRALQADVYGLPVHRTEADQGPAFGAALLAGVAAGCYGDVHEATEVVGIPAPATRPDGERSRAYDELFGVYRGLYGQLSGAMHALGEIEREGAGPAG